MTERFITKRRLFPVLACGIIVVLVSLWPGDVPWGGDDVWLIHEAARGNAAHRLIPAGLGGSFGYPYGPVPVQIYQGLLSITHDLPTVVRLHAFLFSGLTAGGLLWLAAELNLSAWGAVVVMAGPFFWFYSRLLWDNPMAIPAGTLLLASWASLLRTPRATTFLLSAACAITLPMIHPMTLPLAAAVAGHAILTRSKLFARYWPGLVVIAVVVGVSCGPYLQRVGGMIRDRVSPTATPQAGALSRPAAFFFPLLGGRLLSAYYFFDGRGPEAGLESSTAGRLARDASAVVFPVVWLGIIAAAVRRRPVPLICLGALFLQMAMDAAMRVAPFPHYFTGNWVVFVVFFWLGLEAIWARKTARVFIGLSLAASTTLFAIDIHRHGGGQVWYGPSLRTRHASIPS